MTELTNAFEELYLELRAKENRIYTDKQLHSLPMIDAMHPYHKEWKLRRRSSDLLFNYLNKKEKTLHILEIGCGNGWLSAKLAQMEHVSVIGIDINGYEIDQAKRVFKYNNLQFHLADIEFLANTTLKFDVIVFAASIQYFPSVYEIMQYARKGLVEGGEIHILDTNFYQRSTIETAIESSANYFKDKGYPEMKSYYFHHLLTDFESFNYQILYHPKHILNKIIYQNPFYWICVYKR